MQPDWWELQVFIRLPQSQSTIFNTVFANYDANNWSITASLNSTDTWQSFSCQCHTEIGDCPSNPSVTKNKSQASHHQIPEQLLQARFLQIRDGFLWLTPTAGHLSQVAPLFWEQANHTVPALIVPEKWAGFLDSNLKCHCPPHHGLVLLTGLGILALPGGH